MTLLGYSLGMTGNQDEAGRTGPEGAGWARANLAVLRGLIDETIEVIATDTPTNTIEADRRARAITNVARAIKSVETMIVTPRPARNDNDPEDDMSEEQDDDPELVAQLRAELVGRLDRLRASVEAKSLARKPEISDEAAPCEPGAAGIEPSSDRAGGRLADLGDAGRTGGGKDLCGGLLAT